MKICIIGSGIIDAVKGNQIGGAEKQLALIIQGLKAKNIDIIVLDYYLEKPKIINEINFYPAWGKNKSSFFGKLYNLLKNLKKFKVNIIYVRGTQLYVAFLYLLLKMFRFKMNLYWGIAGDHNLTSKYNYLRVNHASSFYEKINEGILFSLSSNLLYYFSDIIICQTTEQIEMCKSKWKNKSIVHISNIYSNQFNPTKIIKKTIANAIWVGKFSGTKGEGVLLRIARDIPEIKIICLGHVTKQFENTTIYKSIKAQKNLVLVGRVSGNYVGDYISKVDFILNTSPSEGLSNVFLEGWDQEKPVISLSVDPNKYLSKGEAGFYAHNSYSDLIEKLSVILKDKKFMDYHGKKGKEILNKYHLIEVIIPKYKKVFSDF